MLAVGCRVSGVGFDCKLKLSVVDALLLVIRCRMSVSVVVVASWLLGDGCRVLIVGCWCRLTANVFHLWVPRQAVRILLVHIY
jgi:hypothetical protein